MAFCGRLAVVLLCAGVACAQEIAGFWRSTLERLRAEPVEAVVKDLREPLPYKTYEVTYRSLGGVRVQALLAMPIGASGRVPAIVTAPGYGGLQQGIMLAECQRGFAILQVYPRTVEGEKLTHGIARPEGAYYQFAYADVIRGIDYLASRGDVDAERIGAAGTSQGGGIVLAVAALDERVKVVAAHVPFLCDFRGAARSPGSLVKQILDKAGKNDEASLRTLDYFDPLQLAGLLRAPAVVSSGGKDMVCPAAGISAVVARMPGVKMLFHDPELTHTTSPAFYEVMWGWLERYLKR